MLGGVRIVLVMNLLGICRLQVGQARGLDMQVAVTGSGGRSWLDGSFAVLGVDGIGTSRSGHVV